MILVLPAFHPRASAQPREAKDPAVASPPLLCGQHPRRSLGPGEGWARPRSLWQKVPRGSISEETQHRNPNQPGGQGVGGGRSADQAVGLQEGGGRKGSLSPARGTPVSPKWESGETEFDRLGGELSVCLSVCLPGGSWGWHRQRGRGCLTCQN